MRRLMFVMTVFLVLAAPGCKKSKTAVQYVEDGGAQLSTAVNVADPRSAIQLLRGFHSVENDAWRWTGPKFAVALRPPSTIPADGAKLYMDYTVPEIFLQKVPQTTLSVMVNGKPLDPEVISNAGSARLVRTVPASMLQGDVATVDFSMDKFLESGTVDQRDLGLIVLTVGFQGATPAPAPPSAK